jgi:hypothetical protein
MVGMEEKKTPYRILVGNLGNLEVGRQGRSFVEICYENGN